jgi:Spy/CpxP family protein refolding chaperone
MSNSLKWRLILGFALVFIAGVVTGSFIGAARSHHGGAGGAHHHLLAERMRNRIQTQLNLTPEEIEKTGPIFDQAARELEQVRTDTARRVHEIMAKADQDLTPALTAEQRAKLEEMEAAHRRKQ